MTCPYCSQAIGPPVSAMNVQDSVVSGDVNITQNVVDSSPPCAICHSQGSTQTACKSCRGIAWCTVCAKEVLEKRHKFAVEKFQIWPVDSAPSSEGLVRERLCDTCWEQNCRTNLPNTFPCCGRWTNRSNIDKVVTCASCTVLPDSFFGASFFD